MRQLACLVSGNTNQRLSCLLIMFFPIRLTLLSSSIHYLNFSPAQIGDIFVKGDKILPKVFKILSYLNLTSIKYVRIRGHIFGYEDRLCDYAGQIKPVILHILRSATVSKN